MTQVELMQTSSTMQQQNRNAHTSMHAGIEYRMQIPTLIDITFFGGSLKIRIACMRYLVSQGCCCSREIDHGVRVDVIGECVRNLINFI